MSLKFKYSKKVNIIGIVLIIGMLVASNWQWRRHLQKKVYIKQLEQNLTMPIASADLLLNESNSIKDLAYRRIKISGEYDFSKEIVLRNRKHQQIPGVFVVTPLKISNSEKYVLVNRGFVPLSYTEQNKRQIFQKEKNTTFTAIIKESVKRRLFAPKDPPTGQGHRWVDAWLRVDIANISKQMPYNLLNVYLEIMPNEDSALAQVSILTSPSGRDEMFFLAGKSQIQGAKEISQEELKNYPIAVLDTVVPPARHLGYVFEWAIMAFITFCICLVLQLSRVTKPQHESLRTT